VNKSNDYNLLLKFIDIHLPNGFQNIRKDDPLMLEINNMMKKNNQFFFIADMIEIKVLFACDTSLQVLGIESKDINARTMFAITHPDDIQRHNVSRSRMIKLCNEIYINQNDFAVLSTNFRFQHAKGHYINMVMQGYVFPRVTPVKTTYCIFVTTDISWFGNIKHGYHYYIGDDMSYFRIPDEELILTGCIFTAREMEILKLIRQGFDSKSMGEKLFISTHTVDTHRRNILKKTRHISTADLIIDLQERGFF